MTAYTVLITLLLVSPWALVGAMVVSAALARLQLGRRNGGAH